MPLEPPSRGMLKGFLIQGLEEPDEQDNSITPFKHPVTGQPIGCILWAYRAAIIQITAETYDNLISKNPDAKLKYVDDDNEEVTVGSSLELAQRLAEGGNGGKSGGYSFSITLPSKLHLPAFLGDYTIMHIFSIGPSHSARTDWNQLERQTQGNYDVGPSIFSNRGPFNKHDLALVNSLESCLMTGDFHNQNIPDEVFIDGYGVVSLLAPKLLCGQESSIPTIVWLKDRLNSLERSIKHYRKRCGKLETRARGMTVDTPTRLSNTITLLRSPMPSASVAPVFWTKDPVQVLEAYVNASEVVLKSMKETCSFRENLLKEPSPELGHSKNRKAFSDAEAVKWVRDAHLEIAALPTNGPVYSLEEEIYEKSQAYAKKQLEASKPMVSRSHLVSPDEQRKQVDDLNRNLAAISARLSADVVDIDTPKPPIHGTDTPERQEASAEGYAWLKKHLESISTPPSADVVDELLPAILKASKNRENISNGNGKAKMMLSNVVNQVETEPVVKAEPLSKPEALLKPEARKETEPLISIEPSSGTVSSVKPDPLPTIYSPFMDNGGCSSTGLPKPEYPYSAKSLLKDDDDRCFPKLHKEKQSTPQGIFQAREVGQKLRGHSSSPSKMSSTDGKQDAEIANVEGPNKVQHSGKLFGKLCELFPERTLKENSAASRTSCNLFPINSPTTAKDNDEISMSEEFCSSKVQLQNTLRTMLELVDEMGNPPSLFSVHELGNYVEYIQRDLKDLREEAFAAMGIREPSNPKGHDEKPETQLNSIDRAIIVSEGNDIAGKKLDKGAKDSSTSCGQKVNGLSDPFEGIERLDRSSHQDKGTSLESQELLPTLSAISERLKQFSTYTADISSAVQNREQPINGHIISSPESSTKPCRNTSETAKSQVVREGPFWSNEPSASSLLVNPAASGSPDPYYIGPERASDSSLWSNGPVPPSIKANSTDLEPHEDLSSASKIADCVEKLNEMGYDKVCRGGPNRLVVYAQATGGNLGEAIDLIEEDELMFKRMHLV